MSGGQVAALDEVRGRGGGLGGRVVEEAALLDRGDDGGRDHLLPGRVVFLDPAQDVPGLSLVGQYYPATPPTPFAWGAVVTGIGAALLLAWLAYFYATSAVIPSMIANQFGRIINISSVNGEKGQAGQTNYSAAKAGMHGFSMALAQEMATKTRPSRLLSFGLGLDEFCCTSLHAPS